MDTLSLPGGRALEYRITGPDDGTVLLHHHGTPGAGTQLGVIADAAHERGLRLLTFSRPGYGDSDRLAGRRVSDVAADAQALLDHLDVRQCLTSGWSGGGPHALATAALLPDKVAAGLVIAGVAPSEGDSLDFLSGMGQPNIEEFGAAAEGEDALRAHLGPDADGLKHVDGPGLVKALEGLIPDVDVAALEAGLAVDLAVDFGHAVSRGIDGWVDDDRAFVAPWGFELGDVQVPTFLWQGTDDLMVPLAHGRWLDARVPGITAHFVEGAGHISVLSAQIGPMLDELTGALGQLGQCT